MAPTIKYIRSIPIGHLHGIKGCVGPVRPTSLILPANAGTCCSDGDEDIDWDDTFVSTHRVVIRSTSSVMREAIGIHEAGLVVRQIGRSRSRDSYS
eukprot:6441300-Amphidinium_carterae.1